MELRHIILLSEESMSRMIDEILSREALQVLDMVDRQCKAIDWDKWYQIFICIEALGLIEESEDTWAQSLVHVYTFTPLGARLWKHYITKGTRKWWNSLAFLRK